MKHIAVVLVSPKEEGNMGAVARVMANLGAERLVLVAPRCAVGERALARACEGTPLLGRAEQFAGLAEVAARFQTLAGFTARTGQDRGPILTPRALAAALWGQENSREGDGMPSDAADAALLFGPEEAGLDNAALQLCHHVVRIPTVAGGSLNLSHAVALALYDLRCWKMEREAKLKEVIGHSSMVTGHSSLVKGDESLSPTKSDSSDPSDPSDPSALADAPAPNAAIEACLAELRAAARLIDAMHPHNEDERLWRWRRLLHRARPSNADIWMLRGLARQIRKRGQM